MSRMPGLAKLSRSMLALPQSGRLPSDADKLRAADEPSLPSSTSSRPEHDDRWGRFFMQLDSLSGALQFGEGFDEAANVEQARRRAAHIFEILKAQPHLVQWDG